MCNRAASNWLQGSVCGKETGTDSEEKMGKKETKHFSRSGEEVVSFPLLF